MADIIPINRRVSQRRMEEAARAFPQFYIVRPKKDGLPDPIEQLRERIASEPEPDEYEQMVTLVCIIGGAVLLLGILALGLLG